MRLWNAPCYNPWMYDNVFRSKTWRCGYLPDLLVNTEVSDFPAGISPTFHPTDRTQGHKYMQRSHITILLRTTRENGSRKRAGVEVESSIMYDLLEQSNPSICSNYYWWDLAISNWRKRFNKKLMAICNVSHMLTCWAQIGNFLWKGVKRLRIKSYLNITDETNLKKYWMT